MKRCKRSPCPADPGGRPRDVSARNASACVERLQRASTHNNAPVSQYLPPETLKSYFLNSSSPIPASSLVHFSLVHFLLMIRDDNEF